MRAPVIGLVAAAALAVASCGRSNQVDEGEVENELREGLGAQAGAEPESVECDGDLPATVGASIRCVLELSGGERLGVTVTATEVADDDVRYQSVVDEELMP